MQALALRLVFSIAVCAVVVVVVVAAAAVEE